MVGWAVIGELEEKRIEKQSFGRYVRVDIWPMARLNRGEKVENPSLVLTQPAAGGQ